MANEDQVKILKQNVEAWNYWRQENSKIVPDLNRASLLFTHLSGANLKHVDLMGANLTGANLTGANLTGADLRAANLTRSNLKGVYLTRANLSGAILRAANLRRADLARADLARADLTGANLSDAVLGNANLKGADLQGVEFTNAKVYGADFTNTDFNLAKGLESVEHFGPSDISIMTLNNSVGNIPEAFLRGCGLSEWEIENAKLYNPNLSNEEITDIQYKVHQLRAQQPIQLRTLFISYSHSDASFVDTVEPFFKQEGIRYWRDIHHDTAGRLEKQIDHAINVNDIVLLVLSEDSTKSDWVEHEARKAREKERKTGKDALCPIALDGSWKTCSWPERLREQIMEYNILDFSGWQDDSSLQSMFAKLIKGLSIFYK